MSPSTDLRENREFASEIKFLVLPEIAAQIRDWACGQLLPDPNAVADSDDAYRITSLYFDTVQFDVFHRRGSFGRSKYRIRRYGESDLAFLERKLKTRGLLTKRRSIVRLHELERLETSESERAWAGHWYHQRLRARRLRPVCEITYRRLARVAMTDHGPIRLTLDDGIRAQGAHGLNFNGVLRDGASISPDRVILELKFRREMPAPFETLVKDFQLKPEPFSKYRRAAVALGFVEETVEAAAAPQNAETAAMKNSSEPQPKR